MQFTRRRAVSGAGAAMLAGPAWAQNTQATAGMIEIPLAIRRNQVFVQVSLDGGPNMPILLDTGAMGLTVFSSLAMAQGLKSIDIMDLVGVGGRTLAPVFQPGTALVGGRLNLVKPRITGIRDIAGTMRGLVNVEFFGLTELDFDKPVLRVFNSARPSVAGYTQLPTKPASYHGPSPQPVVDVEFDGIKCRAMIDTGSSGSLTLFPEFVDRSKLWDKYPKALEGASIGVVGQVRRRVVRAQSLKIAGFTFNTPIVGLGDPAVAEHSGEDVFDGLIGMEILRRFSLLNDPKGRRIGFKPGRQFADVYRYDRGGVNINSNDQTQIHRVAGVLPGGPGQKAGLRPGDRIVAWKGEGGVEGLVWALQGAGGDTVSILIERAGREQEVHVVLEDRL